jgi:hypothetical protein
MNLGLHKTVLQLAAIAIALIKFTGKTILAEKKTSNE